MIDNKFFKDILFQFKINEDTPYVKHEYKYEISYLIKDPFEFKKKLDVKYHMPIFQVSLFEENIYYSNWHQTFRFYSNNIKALIEFINKEEIILDFEEKAAIIKEYKEKLKELNHVIFLFSNVHKQKWD